MLNDVAHSEPEAPHPPGDGLLSDPFETPVYKKVVASDLAEIFSAGLAAPSTPSAPPAGQIKSVRLIRRKPRPSLIAWTICGALAAALGVSGGMVLLKHGGLATVATQANPTPAVSRPPPSLKSAEAPKAVDALVAYAPTASTTLPLEPPAARPQAPANSPSAFDIQSLAKARLKALSRRNSKFACSGDEQGEACRAYVLEADKRLRDTYEKAFHAGVTHEVLVEYRDRWNDLRDRFSANPEALAAGYASLTADLRAEAQFARTGRRPARLAERDD
jgi:hypothetical protein